MANQARARGHDMGTFTSGVVQALVNVAVHTGNTDQLADYLRQIAADLGSPEEMAGFERVAAESREAAAVAAESGLKIIDCTKGRMPDDEDARIVTRICTETVDWALDRPDVPFRHFANGVVAGLANLAVDCQQTDQFASLLDAFAGEMSDPVRVAATERAQAGNPPAH
jgi:hypothetical protein